MNDIKYRAWDKHKKEMYDIARIDITDGSCYTALFGGLQLDFWNDVILMQYTGCQDKNKHDIYEGDILYKDGFWKVFVEKDKGCFRIRSLNHVQYVNKVCDCCIYNFDVENYEVIGNIYQEKNKIS